MDVYAIVHANGDYMYEVVNPTFEPNGDISSEEWRSYNNGGWGQWFRTPGAFQNVISYNVVDAEDAPEPALDVAGDPCATCDCTTSDECVIGDDLADVGCGDPDCFCATFTASPEGESDDAYGWDPRVEDQADESEYCGDATDCSCRAEDEDREFVSGLVDIALSTFIRLTDSDNDTVAALAAERVREFAVEHAQA